MRFPSEIGVYSSLSSRFQGLGSFLRPHHLGAWPICDLTSKQQEHMPVEESGNMLIMIAALAQKSGNTAWLVSFLLRAL